MQVKTLVLVNIKYVTYNTPTTPGKPIMDALQTLSICMSPWIHSTKRKKLTHFPIKNELVAKSHAWSVQNLHVCNHFWMHEKSGKSHKKWVSNGRKQFVQQKRFGVPNLRGFSGAKDSARQIFFLEDTLSYLVHFLFVFPDSWCILNWLHTCRFYCTSSVRFGN